MSEGRGVGWEARDVAVKTCQRATVHVALVVEIYGHVELSLVELFELTGSQGQNLKNQVLFCLPWHFRLPKAQGFPAAGCFGFCVPFSCVPRSELHKY